MQEYHGITRLSNFVAVFILLNFWVFFFNKGLIEFVKPLRRRDLLLFWVCSDCASRMGKLWRVVKADDPKSLVKPTLVLGYGVREKNGA
jgi:hypothetical protein